MLTEQRFDIILKLLEEKKSVTVTELKELLNASEIGRASCRERV